MRPMEVYEVSVIIPIWNAERWLDECLRSLYLQDFDRSLQVSLYNDSSTDESESIIIKWKDILEARNINVVYTKGLLDAQPKGPGYAKNSAVLNSSGRYLCFLDADDWMYPNRIKVQHAVAQSQHPDTIIGSRFIRDPPDSTLRYTKWGNSLQVPDQLYHQAYTSHGPTVLMPTWFCSRSVFDKVGGFDESGKGTPEDLLFFYKHLTSGGSLYRCPEYLMCYRYHTSCTTFSVSESVIWNLRVQFLEKKVIDHWKSFTIWNAGKQGRKLYRSLTDDNRNKVIAFCDVDKKKIDKGFYIFEEAPGCPKPKVPVIHFKDVKLPIIVCVKMDLTDGDFERNLNSLHILEGRDWIHFN